MREAPCISSPPSLPACGVVADMCTPVVRVSSILAVHRCHGTQGHCRRRCKLETPFLLGDRPRPASTPHSRGSHVLRFTPRKPSSYLPTAGSRPPCSRSPARVRQRLLADNERQPWGRCKPTLCTPHATVSHAPADPNRTPPLKPPQMGPALEHMNLPPQLVAAPADAVEDDAPAGAPVQAPPQPVTIWEEDAGGVRT